jgi:hypothetical protein
VHIGKGVPSISIYPNPVSNDLLNMSFNNIEAGVFDVRIFNNLGQLMLSNKINHATGSSSEAVLFGKTLSKGTYQLEIIKPGEGGKETLQFVVGE